MKNYLILLTIILIGFVLQSCNNEPRRSRPRRPISEIQDSSFNQNPRTRNLPSSQQRPQSYNNYNRGGQSNSITVQRLPLNNYEYDCPGWASTFLGNLKVEYLRRTNVPETMLGQNFHDVFDPERTPRVVAEALDLYCHQYMTYVSKQVQFDPHVLDSLVQGVISVSNPVFVEKDKASN